MDRIPVTIHMYQTIDGKIVTDLPHYPDGPECDEAGKVYDDFTFGNFRAWGCGRETFRNGFRPDLTPFLRKKPALVERKAEDDFLCIAIDRYGKNFYADAYNDYAGRKSRYVVATTEMARPEYLLYLESMDIPYLVCGKEDFDIALFLEKLRFIHGIDRFALCGGPQINAEFMRQGFVDRISLVICPGVQGGRRELTPIAGEDLAGFPKYFHLKNALVHKGDCVQLIYEK